MIYTSRYSILWKKGGSFFVLVLKFSLVGETSFWVDCRDLLDGSINCIHQLILITRNYLCVNFFFLAGMVSKKYNDHLDSTTFVMGLVTLLKQYHSEVTDQFFSLLGQYVRSNADSNISKWVHWPLRKRFVFQWGPNHVQRKLFEL